MKKIIISLSIVLFSFLCHAQDYKKEFKNLLIQQDSTDIHNFLQKWEASSPEDPDLFLSYFNFYVLQSQKSNTNINQKSAATTTPLLDTIYYNSKTFEKALNKIDEGIALYPTRLDLRFGKIYTLGEIDKWDSFTSEILKIIQYSNEINNNWLWLDNKELKNGEETFLSSIQSYQQQLYNTGIDSLLNNMKKIATEVVKYYPGHIASLSNLGIVYIIKQDYSSALHYLKKAEHLEPNDAIVLANIAKVYELKNDYLTSKLYYNKILSLPNITPELKQFAKKKLNIK